MKQLKYTVGQVCRYTEGDDWGNGAYVTIPAGTVCRVDALQPDSSTLHYWVQVIIQGEARHRHYWAAREDELTPVTDPTELALIGLAT